MDTYGQFCPIARGAEVFAMRWTPLIVRNMLLGCQTFGEIREGLPGISKTLLSQRLSLLEHYGILERRPNPNGRGSLYELTTAGKELQAVTNSLGAWGSRWLDLVPAHFDAGIVLWALCKTVPADDLPAARTVIRFSLRDGRHRRFWLLLDRPRAEVCAKPPGFEEDVVVETTQQWLTRWYVGEIPLGSAMRQGLLKVRGPRPLVRKLASWGGLGRIDPQPADGRRVASSAVVRSPPGHVSTGTLGPYRPGMRAGIAFAPGVFVLATSLVTAAIKAAAPMIIGGRQLPRRTNALIALLAPALLTALILTETFARGKDLTMDASSVGLACAGVAIALRAPLLLTVIVAAAGTAATRAIT